VSLVDRVKGPNECSAYRRDAGICANGFIQTHFCWFGGPSLPHCLKDELPDHWVKDDGSPAFYRPDLSKGGEE
jgi:hypothetical protein